MSENMFLEKAHKEVIPYIDLEASKLKNKYPQRYENLKPYLIQNGINDYHWESLTHKVGQWKNASHIHEWITNNCCYYVVTIEQLKSLKHICKNVLKESITGNSVDEIETMLPLPEGLNMDEHYLEDVKNTIEIIDKILKETDFSNYALFYRADF